MIPRRAKVLAVASMAASLVAVTLLVADGWALPAVLATVMAPVAAYLLSRASVAPGRAPSA